MLAVPPLGASLFLAHRETCRTRVCRASAEFGFGMTESRQHLVPYSNSSGASGASSTASNRSHTLVSGS